MGKIRVHDVYDKRFRLPGWENLVELVSELTTDRYNPSHHVFLIGSNLDAEDDVARLKQAVEKEGGDSKKIVVQQAHDEDGVPTPFCLRSEEDAETLIKIINNGVRKTDTRELKDAEGNVYVKELPDYEIKPGAIRTVILLNQDDHEQHLERLLLRCPKVTVYAVRNFWGEYLPKEFMEVHPDGIAPREGSATGVRVEGAWRRLSDVEMKRTTFLWPGRIPLGMLTIFAGDPSLGKSTMAYDVIARGSIGADFVDGAVNEWGAFESIILVAEDDVSSIVRPRIEAAGGFPWRVHELTSVKMVGQDGSFHERMASLQEDLALIARRLRENRNIKLVFIDPLSNYLGQADINKEQEVRRVLKPVRDLAEELEVSFLFNAHFNKQVGKAAIHKVIGAVGNVGICRMGWSFVKSNEDPNVKQMLLMKENLGKFPGLSFTTESVDVLIEGEPVSQARIKYLGEAKESADEQMVLAEDPEARKEAMVAQIFEKHLPPDKAGEWVNSAPILKELKKFPKRLVDAYKHEHIEFKRASDGRTMWKRKGTAVAESQETIF